MQKIYADNGLPFYTDEDIRDRQYLADVLKDEVGIALRSENKAWQFYRTEAPCLIPTTFVSVEYANDAIFTAEPYILRPETTGASYAYASHLLEHQKTTPPVCVWQLAKSFRRENDQVSANMRFKEFYQQEFQCIFTADTKNDYQKILPQLEQAIGRFTGLETRIVESDRLPHYSQKTLDIEVKTPHKWLEVCSSSIRTDVPFDWNGKKLMNVEFAFGIDRIVCAKPGI